MDRMKGRIMGQALEAMDHRTLVAWARQLDADNTRLRSELLQARVDRERIAELEAIIERHNTRLMRKRGA